MFGRFVEVRASLQNRLLDSLFRKKRLSREPVPVNGWWDWRRRGGVKFRALHYPFVLLSLVQAGESALGRALPLQASSQRAKDMVLGE